VRLLSTIPAHPSTSSGVPRKKSRVSVRETGKALDVACNTLFQIRRQTGLKNLHRDTDNMEHVIPDTHLAPNLLCGPRKKLNPKAKGLRLR